MTSAPQSQIVHESEAQRQHVRLPLPAKAFIDGKEYAVRDLSSAGVGISDLSGNYARGQKISLTLKLPFGAFSLDVNLQGEVRYYNAQEKLLGCNFVGLTTDQLSLLNHVLKAFLAGDVVASGDLMNVAARDSMVKARKQASSVAGAPPSFDIKRQIPGLVAMAVMGIIAIYIIGGNLYESAFILKSTDAYVSTPLADVKASGDGVFKSMIEPGTTAVQSGQVIAEITGAGFGAPPNRITSPCQCVIANTLVNDGQYVTAGTTLMTLSPVDAKPVVIAAVEPVSAGRIKSNSKTTITIAGTQKEFSGHVSGMKSGMARESVNPQFGYVVSPVLVTITPDQPLPADMADVPARVVFTTR